MAEERLFIDDRVVIPEKIKNMSSDERRAKIRQLEEEARAEKREFLRKSTEEPLPSTGRCYIFSRLD